MVGRLLLSSIACFCSFQQVGLDFRASSSHVHHTSILKAVPPRHQPECCHLPPLFSVIFSLILFHQHTSIHSIPCYHSFYLFSYISNSRFSSSLSLHLQSHHAAPLLLVQSTVCCFLPSSDPSSLPVLPTPFPHTHTPCLPHTSPPPPCLVCLTLWAAAVCLTVSGYEDMGQASGSGDFCKGGYGTAVAAAASAQNKPASSVTGPGVGECRHKPNEEKLKQN